MFNKEKKFNIVSVVNPDYENKYLENEVNNLVIVIDKKNNSYLSISVKVND